MEKYYLICAYILAGVVGLCVGSFLNVVIYRVPEGMSIAKPASHCPKCGYELKWYDNIPVLSYLMLGGKCRSCKEHISFRYTVVELLNALLWVLSVALFWKTSVVYALLSMAVSSVLVCVACIDKEHLFIPDRFQIVLLCLGVTAIFFSGLKWYHHLIGGAVGFLIFFTVGFVGEKVKKKEALGFGDVKLAGVCGLLLGWQKWLLAMMVASLSAMILLLIVRIANKDDKDTEYCFAPFIASGVLVALFFGSIIITAYLSLFQL